jgi:hypothetical protein
MGIYKTIEILTPERAKVIAEATFEWCLKEFGSPIEDITPKLKISYDKRVRKLFGGYENQIITVYPHVCKTKKDLIRTILHEYRHFMQMPNKKDIDVYWNLDKNFDYKEHPFEIDSLVFEKKQYRRCKTYLKSKNLFHTV